MSDTALQKLQKEHEKQIEKLEKEIERLLEELRIIESYENIEHE